NNIAKNARIHIATYQSLRIHEFGDASFLRKHYPENHFSYIVIDECHRSAWGTWSEVLIRNQDAFQIGLTATLRKLTGPSDDGKPQIPGQLIAMSDDLFQYRVETGGPEQKAIVCCAADAPADRVASHLHTRCTECCKANGRARAEPYAYRCTALG